eukprot:350874-Chlamydomonas_euryale.AAC.14
MVASTRQAPDAPVTRARASPAKRARGDAVELALAFLRNVGQKRFLTQLGRLYWTPLPPLPSSCHLVTI